MCIRDRLDDHGCTGTTPDKRLPQCPLCNQGVVVREAEGETADRVVDAHINSGCKSHLAEQVRAQRSAMSKCQHGKGKKACKDSSLLKHTCKDCGKMYCMKHRHHECEPVTVGATMSLASALQSLKSKA
eukprot:TRINITY_DN16785_c0_g1_i4.p1 TRINITY_DN16785_c0_g1~~TRINITY_DN16785_c0_g1_i4.p1  ORF type:complete len:129 (+),score=18.98 TRINITY_DN16785_c0_g1_i4:180-566(+)